MLKMNSMINTNSNIINGGDLMKLTKNIGELDRLLRLSFGFSMLGYGIAKDSGFSILMGSWKIAEGITGISLMYHLMGVDTLENRFNFSGSKEFILRPIEKVTKVDDME